MADETLEREFPTAVAVSAMTGFLLGEETTFGDVHECLEWMAGEPVWTHQLPRVSEEVEAVMRKRGHGSVIDHILALEDKEPDEVMRVVQPILDALPATMKLPRLSATEHQRIAPLTELEAMVNGRPEGAPVQ